MVIDVFFTTRDKVALHTFSLVIKAHQEWRKSLLNICAQHGFESFCGPDFCTPDYFLQERFSQKLRGRGFNPVYDKSIYVKSDYEVFTLRRDYPAGAEIYRQIDDLSRTALESVNLRQEVYGRPRHVGYQHAACILLGIDHTFNKSDITAFSQVWRVIDSDGAEMLVSAIPATLNEEDKMYYVPAVPDVWEKISSHEVISLFNTHNAQLKGEDVKWL
ncbi:TPA: hypothetical protein RFM61_001979 [Klebsiella pneumoniae subsp. pneumoniae]|uniref:hypothetical protein n=1 Tax=Klebsiella pneumoniae TaxID=573 RepID=UPI000D1B0C47|nr:hypothetical protein [Klebsiella pneumoniae]HBX5762636.1 hypothetical protein [Klebsiella pneumoniae]HCF8051400.1 hypothetical protein [Klebsiella pneumoniae]HDU3837824.1 hypothetical protein [Klebsiella pneumoniae subsp. pneumoniae]